MNAHSKISAKKNQKITKDWLSTASALWAEGRNVNYIARATGLHPATARDRILRRPHLFPERVTGPLPEAAATGLRSFIGNDRWVERIPYTTISGAVVSLPRVSIINGKEG